MLRSWLINSRGIAKKVKNATRSSDQQIKDCGANRECPNCQYRIDNSDVFPEWPGLPVGVKFEPSDEELVEHLAAKCGVENIKPQMFIEEFIPTLVGEGIYSDHPENLPGAKKDGSRIHFFHKTVNAYSTGQKKRRKVSHHGSGAEHVRWHKTGKTKPVIENGVQKGWKKIMVLYKSTKKGSKPDKTNWVMHQYHLGAEEDEREGEFVVSKICYQKPKHPEPELNDNKENSNVVEHGKSILSDDIANNNLPLSSAMEEGHVQEETLAPKNDVQLEDDTGHPAWFAGESQAVEDADLTVDDFLLCKEIFFSVDSHTSNTNFHCNGNKFIGEGVAPCSVTDLENIELDTPPDFELSNLQFCSQDSFLDWFDGT